ncbi:hypothetical protein NDN08_002269 [Rhodosorus marinus]|uniref:Pentatricopeptide repeat-containing protein-mitochondrial domain-containing protein n=1 Tax=Rhodosorus marinus TaxID=101924 RepID=A0AAV8UT95_9RHOD|nr:hypothetical protein NDN08_002269 [Rhodosorus marinus]
MAGTWRAVESLRKAFDVAVRRGRLDLLRSVCCKGEKHLSDHVRTAIPEPRQAEHWHLEALAYYWTGDRQRLFFVLKEMRSCGVMPPESAYASLIEISLEGRQANMAQATLVEALRAGYTMKEAACEEVFKICLHSGSYPGCRAIYEALRENEVFIESVYRKIVWLSGKYGDLRLAKDSFAELNARGIDGDEEMYIALILAFARQNDFVNAFAAFDEMRLKRIEPSARTWHTMIEVQSRVGNMDSMTALYEEALRSKVKSLYSLIEVHNAYLTGVYRCTADTRLMEKAFNDISEKYGLEPNRSSYSIMIKAYVRSREYQQAKEALLRCVEAGIEPNYHMSTTLLSMYGRAGDVRAAEELFAGLRESRVKLNSFHYSTMIGLLRRHGEVAKAMELVNSLNLMQIPKDEMLSASIIDLHGNNSRLSSAVEVFQEAPVRTVVIYEAIMRACIEAGDYEQGSKFFTEMVSKNIEPRKHTYHLGLKLARETEDVEFRNYLSRGIGVLVEDATAPVRHAQDASKASRMVFHDALGPRTSKMLNIGS